MPALEVGPGTGVRLSVVVVVRRREGGGAARRGEAERRGGGGGGVERRKADSGSGAGNGHRGCSWAPGSPTTKYRNLKAVL